MKICTKIFSAVAACALISACICVYAFADNTKYYLDDRSVFECEAFSDWIRQNVDGGRDGRLSEWECLRVGEIDVSGETQIKSVKGVEVFSNLFSLDVSGSGISYIDVSRLTRLAFLNVENTNIKELDLTHSVMMYDLNADDTQISEIDTSPCNELHSLSVKRTGIRSLDLRKNTDLFYISGRESRIESISLASARLSVIDLAYTDVSELDISGCSSLAHLDLSGSRLERIDLSWCTSLEYIDLSGTNVTETDTSRLEELRHLDLSHTKTVGINTEKNKKLSYLNISDTDIDSVDLSENKSLDTLTAANTRIKEIDLSQCKNIAFLLLPTEAYALGSPEKTSDLFGEAKASSEEKSLPTHPTETEDEIKEKEIKPKNSGVLPPIRTDLCVLHKNTSLCEGYFLKKLSRNLLKK